ncbi:hypothetical protein DNTS_003315 [Danionella cerebrum]|uniref:Uncharacterized protein n=1 Tax=Danionella cerebrum TaxID=2873325 RepID=A0A553MVP3_9TELE|nr:hypothetical protein DNTS_003315 [Danionella translucida]
MFLGVGTRGVSRLLSDLCVKPKYQRQTSQGGAGFDQSILVCHCCLSRFISSPSMSTPASVTLKCCSKLRRVEEGVWRMKAGGQGPLKAPAAVSRHSGSPKEKNTHPLKREQRGRLEERIHGSSSDAFSEKIKRMTLTHSQRSSSAEGEKCNAAAAGVTQMLLSDSSDRCLEPDTQTHTCQRQDLINEQNDSKHAVCLHTRLIVCSDGWRMELTVLRCWGVHEQIINTHLEKPKDHQKLIKNGLSKDKQLRISRSNIETPHRPR